MQRASETKEQGFGGVPAVARAFRPFSAKSLLAGALLLLGCSGQLDPGVGDPFGDVPGAERPVVESTPFTPSPRDDGTSLWCSAGVSSGRRSITNVALTKISLFQGVEIPLSLSGALVERNADVVAGRPAFVRVHLEASSPVSPSAQLTLEHEDGTSEAFVESLPDVKTLSGITHSMDLELDTTLNFRIPADAVRASSRLSVRLFEEGACAGAGGARQTVRQEGIPLRARNVGGLQIVLVPIRFDADGSGRLPDTDAEALGEAKSLLEAIFPIPGVEFSLHEPVGTTESELEGMLPQMLELRDREGAGPGVSYFGLVNPKATMGEYCGKQCVAGISAMGDDSGKASYGVAVGFRGHTPETFVHELGHMFRLRHAPCGEPTNPDGNFPYEDGRIGSLGFDLRTGTLVDSASASRDFMSYCDPTWISDYNYQNLIESIAVVNRTETDGPVSSSVSSKEFERYVVSNVSGKVRKLPEGALVSEPVGEEATVEMLDSEGRLVGTLVVRRVSLSEESGAVVYVPKERTDAARLRFADGSELSLLAEKASRFFD